MRSSLLVCKEFDGTANGGILGLGLGLGLVVALGWRDKSLLAVDVANCRAAVVVAMLARSLEKLASPR